MNARRDDNRVPALIGVSNADGFTPTIIYADPVTKRLLVDSNAASGFGISGFDYVGATYPDNVTEVYIYKSGGSGGTTIATLTVVYTSSTKESFLSATKT